jgi:hypothetical protein
MGAPREHIRLMALLNQSDLNIMSKYDAMQLTERLLNEG